MTATLTTRSMVLCAASLLCSLFVAVPRVAADDRVLQRIEQLERELRELKEQLAEKEKKEARAANVADGKALPTHIQVGKGITFKPGLRVQGRYTHAQDDSEHHDFQVKRLRLKGGGNAFGLANYYTEVKIDSTTSAASSSATSSVKAKVENAWLEFNTLPETNIRVGLYDIPFSRDALTSDSKLLFQDRSLIKDALTGVGFADNTIGILFHEMPMDGRLEYAVGIFENNQFDKVPTTAGRLVLNLLDPGKAEGARGSYGGYRGSYVGQGQRLAIAINGAYTSDATDPGDATNFDVYAFGGDLYFNSGIFTVQGEYDWFKKDMSDATPNIETEGGFLQGGVLIGSLLDRVVSASWLPPIELAGRYQHIRNEDMAIPDTWDWYSVGLNAYVRGHNLKFQTDYTWKDEDSGEIDNDALQLQMQLDF